jgi:hypothetical protein
MKQRSSTMRAVLGNSSQTHIPHLPWRAKRYLDGATGKRAWPLVMVVSRWPMRMLSGRLTSKKSFILGL